MCAWRQTSKYFSNTVYAKCALQCTAYLKQSMSFWLFTIDHNSQLQILKTFSKRLKCINFLWLVLRIPTGIVKHCMTLFLSCKLETVSHHIHHQPDSCETCSFGRFKGSAANVLVPDTVGDLLLWHLHSIKEVADQSDVITNECKTT